MSASLPSCTERHVSFDPQEAVQNLSSELGLSQKEALYMMSKQPSFLMGTPAATLKSRLEELAAAVQLPEAEVLQWAAVQPSVLKRDAAVMQRKVESFAELFGVNNKAMVRMITTAPQYLTDSCSSVETRLEAMRRALRKPRNIVVRMVQLQPDVVFMSPRIFRNKLRVRHSQHMLILQLLYGYAGLILAQVRAELQPNLISS